MTAAEALGCQACGLPVTPCLVCAHPLPLSPNADSPLIKTCRSCGVVNLLGDRYREVLDIPPASALPSEMVRRAQIARVGRRPYVLAKHAHFMHLSSVSGRMGEDDQGGGAGSPGLAVREIIARLGPRGSSVPEIFASAEEGQPLTFLPYMQDTEGARMYQEAVRWGRKAVDARRFYPVSDSESPVKRMRLLPSQEVQQGEKNLSGSVCPNPGFVCNGVSSLAAVSNGRTSSLCTPLERNSAIVGESTGQFGAGSGFASEPPVRSSDCKNDSRPTIGGVDDGEVRSTAEDGKGLIHHLVGPSHDVVEDRVGVANQLATGKVMDPFLQPIRSASNQFESFKSPLQSAQHHEGRAEAPTSGASVLNSIADQRCKYFEHDFYPRANIATFDKLPSTSVQNVDDGEELDAHEPEVNRGREPEVNDVHEPEVNDAPGRDVTGSEEVPTRRRGRVCLECGQTSGGSRSAASSVEAGLMRCCTQLLELHCPYTLRSDMRTPCAYPLCCPVPRFPLPASMATSSTKVCQSYVTQFTVDALRAAHSILTSSTQESTSEEVASPFRGVEQVLSAAETFIEIKERMGQVQGLIQQVDAATSQASRDFKAYGDHGAFALARQLIPLLLNREKQQSVDRLKNDVQVMTAFLQDINKLLTTCFHYVEKILEPTLCSAGDSNRGDSKAMSLNVFMLDVDVKRGLDAVRAAVLLWLRLYHDVAHASGLL